MSRQLPPDFDLEKNPDAPTSFNDGPTNRSAQAFKDRLGKEIAAAGGIEAYRAQHAEKQKQAA